MGLVLRFGNEFFVPENLHRLRNQHAGPNELEIKAVSCG